MERIVFENILNGLPFDSQQEFDSDFKIRLYSTMDRFGMSGGLTFDRFFVSGFKSWEIKGVMTIVKSYVDDRKLPSSVLETRTKFYRKLKDPEDFICYMGQFGMDHKSVDFRFRGWAFFEWEDLGIGHIVENFLLKG